MFRLQMTMVTNGVLQLICSSVDEIVNYQEKATYTLIVQTIVRASSPLSRPQVPKDYSASCCYLRHHMDRGRRISNLSLDGRPNNGCFRRNGKSRCNLPF